MTVPGPQQILNAGASGSPISSTLSTPATQGTTMAQIYAQDPNKVVNTIGGVNYNYAGDPIKAAAPPAAPTVDPGVAAAKALLASINAQNAYNIYTGKLPDIKAIDANSLARASGDVNPLYTLRLNNFLSDQATQKNQQQKQIDFNLQNIEDQLKQTQEGNAITGQRTTEDTATKEAQAAQATDWRQTDQGGQYNMDRIAEAINQAKSGLTGSGIAAGQTDTSRDKFLTTESRQATQDQQQKDATELAKARTFEDLARSNVAAGTQAEKGKTQQNLDLSKFIENQAIDLRNKKDDLEQARQSDILAKQANYRKLAYQDFFQNIANPAQRAAFAKTYGAFL